MKNQKVEKEIVYEGLGFPIILRNVPMIKIRDVWTLDIDLNILQKVVLLAIAHHQSNITGNQIRFIRHWLGLTQTEFSKLFGVTHPAASKWEKAGNTGCKMSLTTQRDLRLWLLDHLLSQDDDFRKAFKIIHMHDYSEPIKPLTFDAATDLIAI